MWQSPRRARSPRPTAPRDDADEQWAIIEALPAGATSSTARDVTAGRTAELDAIGGAIVRAGPDSAFPTPRSQSALARALPSAIALIGARSGSERVPTRTSARSPGTRCSRTRSRRRSRRASSSASSSPPTREGSPRSRAGTGPTCRSSARPSTRRRPRPTSSGSRSRSSGCHERYDLFAIVRATNPFRGPDVVRRGLEQLLATPEADSIRAVELVKQHPGKMWLLDDDGRTMRPLLDQSHLDVAWHAGQYQALPRVYHQNSALEIAWTRVVAETGTREGRVLAPFLTEGHEGFNVDDEDDWSGPRQLVASGAATLTELVAREPYPAAREGRLARDAVLRRRLAAVDLRQGDDGRRARRLVRGDRLARLADAGSPASSRPGAARRRPRPARGRGHPLGPLPRDAAEPGLDRRRRRSAGSRTRCSTSRRRRSASRCTSSSAARRGTTVPLYWSHCGTTRARAWEVTGRRSSTRTRRSPRSGARSSSAAFRAFKTNIVVPGDEPQVLMPGFGAAAGSTATRRPSCSTRSRRLLEAFREGTGGKAQPIVDLNFNLTTEGHRPRRAGARAVRPRVARGRLRTTRPRSPTRGAARRSRSAPARTSTRCAASGRSSRRARWTSPPST